MSTITINIPEKLNKNEVSNWIQLLLSNIEVFEDFLLWLKIKETENEGTISLNDFLLKNENRS